jgi:hypothetical protein
VPGVIRTRPLQKAQGAGHPASKNNANLAHWVAWMCVLVASAQKEYMGSLTADSAEFRRLLDALGNELVDAKFHFSLHQNLQKATPEYWDVFHQSNTFWTFTLNAHMDAVILRLCKAYDQYGAKPTLNLRSLLETIKDNLHLFDEPNFRERLKDNPFVDSLATEPRKPDAAQLQEDLDFVCGNHLVKKLNEWRNKVYSHLSLEVVLNPKEFNTNSPLSFAEIETLLKNGLTILNRYSGLFAANFYSTMMIGRDDYLYVLKAVKEALRAYEARIEAQVQAIQNHVPADVTEPSDL